MKFNKQKFEKDIQGTILQDVIDLPYMMHHGEYDDPETLRDDIERMISEHEVIYYSRAMEYLSENDPSLSESLELAADCGYSPEKLNSEILATLHIQNSAMNEIPDLDDYFSDDEEEAA